MLIKRLNMLRCSKPRWIVLLKVLKAFKWCHVLLKKLKMYLKLRSSMTSTNRPLRATVGQNSSSIQMAAANHVGAAVLVHVARSGRLDDVIDERSFSLQTNLGISFIFSEYYSNYRVFFPTQIYFWKWYCKASSCSRRYNPTSEISITEHFVDQWISRFSLKLHDFIN